MFDIDKILGNKKNNKDIKFTDMSLSKTFGNNKFSDMIASVTNKPLKNMGASPAKQNQWVRYTEIKRNEKRSEFKDSDGDRIPDDWDCQPNNIMRQDSFFNQQPIQQSIYRQPQSERRQSIYKPKTNTTIRKKVVTPPVKQKYFNQRAEQQSRQQKLSFKQRAAMNKSKSFKTQSPKIVYNISKKINTTNRVNKYKELNNNEMNSINKNNRHKPSTVIEVRNINGKDYVRSISEQQRRINIQKSIDKAQQQGQTQNDILRKMDGSVVRKNGTLVYEGPMTGNKYTQYKINEAQRQGQKKADILRKMNGLVVRKNDTLVYNNI